MGSNPTISAIQKHYANKGGTRMKIITIIAIGGFSAVAILTGLLVARPKSQEERDYEDQEQTEYLIQWQKEHPKKSRATNRH